MYSLLVNLFFLSLASGFVFPMSCCRIAFILSIVASLYVIVVVVLAVMKEKWKNG